ncbi:MAG: GAF domain-containing protein [Nitrospirae bacterium]|nr:GAF domain-containing protein [Nitrospirota bacterium]
MVRYLLNFPRMIDEQQNKSNIALLKEITGFISATDNLDSITNLVLELSLCYTGARHGSVLIVNDNGDLVIRAARGISPEVIPSIRIKKGEHICGKVAENKTPLLIKDIHTDVRIGNGGSGNYKTGSFICCPVMMREDLLGIINVSDKADGAPFTEDDMDLIEILADQTALSLGCARLSADMRTMSLELDERNRALIDSDRLRSEFAAVLTHEFRTHLNSIAGAAYHLRENRVSPGEQKEFVHIISSETDKLSNLLDGILDFRLLEKEERLLKKRVLNVRDILRELTASRTVKEILARNNVSINVSCPDSLPYTVGDGIRLARAFIHLIDGIGKYTAPGDTMELTAAAENSSTRITLSIKGRRIPDTELPHLFDSRATWKKTYDNRNRLKFYLAQKTIELHKGVVSVLNTPEGIAVQLLFPHYVKDHREARTDEITGLLLAIAAETMNLNKCSIMLKDEQGDELVIKNAIGFDEDIIRQTRTAPGDNIAGWVSAENKPLLIEDIERHPYFGRKSSSQYTTKSLLCLPIFIDDRVIGVLNLNNKANGLPFDGNDLYLASALIERMARIIEKAQREDVTDKEFRKTVGNLETLLHARQQYKKKNGVMSSIILRLMKQMRRGDEEIKQALYSAAFYDLGLTRMDECILMKSGELSAVEEKIIKTHPFPSAGLAGYMETDDTVSKVILHHHERYDGLGYPCGLQGTDIPFLSRVLNVADAYTAMTAARPYRRAFSPEEAKVRVMAGAGKQFDPHIVDAFMKII